MIANGGLHDPDLARRVLADGHGDLVALGEGALANPDWPQRIAEGRAIDPYDGAMLKPEVTIENAWRWRAAKADQPVG